MHDLILQSAGVAGIVVALINPGGCFASYCSGGSPLVRFLARSITVTAIRISARVLRSGASSIACFSAGP